MRCCRLAVFWRMRHRLFLHVVWTTRDREPLLDAPLAEFLGRTLPAIARKRRATLLALGAVTTHVHLVARIEPLTVIPELLRHWKGGVSVLAAREDIVPAGRLRWAKGYNVDSVGLKSLEYAIGYVLSQPRRHPKLAIEGWEPIRYNSLTGIVG